MVSREHERALPLVTVRPARAALTRAGRWLEFLVLPWLIGFAVASNWALTVLGYPAEARHALVPPVLVALAVAPGVVFLAHIWLGRIRGFRWMLEPTQPLARLDHLGIELSLPGQDVRRFVWDTVARLIPSDRWGQPAELIGTDGSTLALIPDSLVHGRRTSRSRETLARAVVEVRPDRYAISGANWAGLPDAFALRGMAQESDARRAIRRGSLMVAALAALLIGGAVVGGAIWILSQS